MYDNFHFDLTGVSLEKALRIAFNGDRKDRLAIGWLYSDTRQDFERLTLFCTDDGIIINKFPSPLDVNGTVIMVADWLKHVNYGKVRCTGIPVEKGWRIYRPEHRPSRAFVAIEPTWLIRSK